MIVTVPFNQTDPKNIFILKGALDWLLYLTSDIKPQFSTFNEAAHRLRPNKIVSTIQSNMNGVKDHSLSHLETKYAKTENKNGIRMKN
jgi:hypothetical protein